MITTAVATDRAYQRADYLWVKVRPSLTGPN